MSGPAWFTPHATERHEITFPGALVRAAEMRQHGTSAEGVELFLAEHTIWVELRGLSAGDRALLDELRFTDEGEGKLSFGEQKIRAVELCLVNWSLSEPLLPEKIRQLNALVLDLIFAAIPDGLQLESESGGANGSGPPPPAALVPPAQLEDAPKPS